MARTRSDRGSGRVTLVRIAAVLRVTPMTVSNAYSRPDQLSPELRERVLATAERLGSATRGRALWAAACGAGLPGLSECSTPTSSPTPFRTRRQ